MCKYISALRLGAQTGGGTPSLLGDTAVSGRKANIWAGQGPEAAASAAGQTSLMLQDEAPETTSKPPPS